MRGLKYKKTDSFEKNLKRLEKRFSTLLEDLESVKKHAIQLFHLQKIDMSHIVQIPGYPHKSCRIYKIRTFACKALKGSGSKSGIRIIYAYHPAQDLVEFIEMYYKGDKELEDKDLIKSYLEQVI